MFAYFDPFLIIRIAQGLLHHIHRHLRDLYVAFVSAEQVLAETGLNVQCGVAGSEVESDPVPRQPDLVLLCRHVLHETQLALRTRR